MTEQHIPQFMVAAPSSNSGKTTVTLGLLQALAARRFAVQPFKCGPDYLDTHLHTKASGINSINLDLFMSSDQHVQHLYRKHACDKQVTVIESVMGLFDGAVKDQKSSAEIAALLGVPIVLVVDARAMAYSAAPLLYGFRHFNEHVHLAGVIFNFVNSDSHYQFLKAACEDVGIPSFGYLPKNEKVQIPSRHLGLNIDPDDKWGELFRALGEHVNNHINIEALLQATSISIPRFDTDEAIVKKGNYKIAVARDAAFNFTYYENLKVLEQYGEIIFFSPIYDDHLPQCDLVYLSGGYPELYLQQLSDNVSMNDQIRNYIENGGKVLAECGGMMYLGKQIVNKEGKPHPMINIFPFATSMEQAKLSLGYRKFSWEGKKIMGHEFHYSNIKHDENISTIGRLTNASDQPVHAKVYQYKNVIASYIHFYWGEEDFLLKALLDPTG